MWRDLLPTQIKSQIATLEITDHDSFKVVIDKADQIYESLQQAPKVAGVKVKKSNKSNGQEKSDPEDAAIAAVRGGNWRGRGGRGRGQPQQQRGAGQGQGARGGRGVRRSATDRSTWGDPHPDGPPPEACMQHWVYGKSAWICIT